MFVVIVFGLFVVVFFLVMTFCKVSHKNFTQFHARISRSFTQEFRSLGMFLLVINVSKPLHHHKTTRGCIKLAFTRSSSFTF